MSFIGKKFLDTTKFYLGKYFSNEEIKTTGKTKTTENKKSNSNSNTKANKEGIIKKNNKSKKHKKEIVSSSSNSDTHDSNLMVQIKKEIVKQNHEDAEKKKNTKRVSP